MVKPTPNSNQLLKSHPTEDEFSEYLNLTRRDLTLGNLTDDELAGYVFMCGDDTSSPGTSIGALTAAKERIRWLTRQDVRKEKLLKQLHNIANNSDDTTGYRLEEVIRVLNSYDFDPFVNEFK